MLSCTNQIESFHGHLIAIIPRRNSFFSSIKKPIDEIIQEIDNFFTDFQQNYKCHQRKIKNIIKTAPYKITIIMINGNEAKIDKQICTCGKSILIKSSLNVHLPC